MTAVSFSTVEEALSVGFRSLGLRALGLGFRV